VDLDTGQIANRLSEVSQPVRQRTTRKIRDLDDATWRWINNNGVVYKSASKATRVVRATGTTGREALESLGKDGRAALLRLSDDVTTTRSILKVWQGGDISTREMGTLLRHLNEVSGDEAKIADDIIDSSGDGGIELLAKGEVCNSPCDRVDEVLDDIDADLSSVDQEDVTEVGTKLSRAVEDDEISVAEANDLLGDIERLAKDGEDVTDLFTGSDTVVTNRLIRRHAEGDLDRSHLKRIDEFVESGTMDQADVRRLTEMLEQRGSDPLIDDSIDADDLLSEVNKNGDLRETIAISKSEDGTVNWLEEGRLAPETRRSDEYIVDEGGAGWEHIKHNRIDNPDGNQFLRYGDKFESKQEVKDLLFETLDNGESVRIDGSQWYRYEVPNSGGKHLSVLVGDNGFTVTAIPTKVTK